MRTIPLLLATALSWQSCRADGHTLRVVQDDQSIRILQADRTILVYNKQSPPLPEGVDPVYRRSGFLHPVMSPAGHTVTATFPRDHLHQHGIFSAWVKTSWQDQQIDFWNLAGRTGRVQHTKVIRLFVNDESAGFEVNLAHQATTTPPTAILTEHWKVTAWTTDDSHFCFDLETTQAAVTTHPLLVHQHRYGGVAVRGPSAWILRNLRQAPGDSAEHQTTASSFLTDAGFNRRAGNHQHARWVAMNGQVDGSTVSIAMLSHTENPRSPQTVRLHPTKPYFCFSPCVDGEFRIDRDHPYQARYRFLITDELPNSDWLDSQWTAWCQPLHPD